MSGTLTVDAAVDRAAVTHAWVVDCVLDRPAMLTQCGTAPAPSRASADGVEVLLDGELFDIDALAAQWNLPPTNGSDAAAVALEAFRRHGIACAEVLNGRFALLIADRRTRQLFAIRDRIGFHPLFYADSGKAVLFSPSIPALLAQPHVSRAVDRVVLAEHLMNRWVDVNETYFGAVRRVPPGHLLTITSDGRSNRRYWNPGARGWLKEKDSTDFEGVFERAVSRCMTQGRTGIWLSGGFDSVSVAAMVTDLARRNGTPEPHALSLGFPDPDSNEEFLQRSVAQSLGISQDFVQFGQAVAAQGGVVRSAMAMGADWPQPMQNFWHPAYAHLARLGVSRGCRAILTGTGGDEWLNVSPFLSADLLRQGRLIAVGRLAASNHRSFKFTKLQALRSAVWRFGARPLMGRALEARIPWIGARRRATLRATPAWVAPDPALRQRMADRVGKIRSDTRPPTGMGFYEWQMQMALEHPLVTMEYEDHFEFGRRLGVRLFHPYLDPDLVELLYRTPPAVLIKGGRSKALVRQTLARRFPTLGFERQRKLDATTFFRSTLLREGIAGWQSIGGATALHATGVVSAPDWEAELRRLAVDERSPEIYRIWMVLNLETWARAQT